MGWTTISPWRPIAGSGQNITVGASSTQATNAIGDNAQAIQISTTGSCHVAIGAVRVDGVLWVTVFFYS